MIAVTIRSHERARVTELVRTDHENFLLLVGEAGVGKSRLLSSINTVPGAVVRRVRINAGERAIAYSGISAILASLRDREAAAQSDQFLVGDETDDLTAAVRVLDLIRRVAPPATLMLIDDVDHMDPASQRILALLALRLTGTGLSIAGTATSTDGPLTGLPSLALRPLTDDEALALARSLHGTTVDEAVLRMAVADSAGSPATLVHILRALTDDQLLRVAPVTVPFPPRGLERSTLNALRSRAESSPLIQRLAASSVSTEESIVSTGVCTRDTLDDLVDSGVVFRFGNHVGLSDPRLRSVAYYSMTPAARRDLHVAAAADEAQHDRSLECWHRSFGQPEVIHPSALVSAAQESATAGLPRQAIELAERSLVIDHAREVAAEDYLKLARSLLRSGDLASARRYSRVARRRSSDRAIAARADLLKAEIDYFGTQASTGPGFIVDAAGGTDEIVNARVTLAAILAERWETDEAAEMLLGLDGTSLAGLDAGTRDHVDLVAAFVAAQRGDPAPTDRILATTAAEHPNERATALVTLGHGLTALHRYEEAHALLQAVLDLEPPPPPTVVASARIYLIENAIIAETRPEAMTMMNALLAAEPPSQLHENLRLLDQSWYERMRNDGRMNDSAMLHYEEALLRSGSTALLARMDAYHGRAALAAGDFSEAATLLSSAMSRGVSPLPSLLRRYLADLIEALVMSRRTSDARRWLTTLREPSQLPAVAVDLARAEALMTEGFAALARFEFAETIAVRSGRVFDAARAALCHADRLAALGESEDAGRKLMQARRLFTRISATHWLRRTERTAAPVVQPEAPHPLLEKLSADERAVALLVRDGRSNKQIASALFVSQRTVEVRLTRIYRTLGATSRWHLAAMLAEVHSDEVTPALAPSG